MGIRRHLPFLSPRQARGGVCNPNLAWCREQPLGGFSSTCDDCDVTGKAHEANHRAVIGDFEALFHTSGPIAPFPLAAAIFALQDCVFVYFRSGTELAFKASVPSVHSVFTFFVVRDGAPAQVFFPIFVHSTRSILPIIFSNSRDLIAAFRAMAAASFNALTAFVNSVPISTCSLSHHVMENDAEDAGIMPNAISFDMDGSELAFFALLRFQVGVSRPPPSALVASR